MTNGYRGEVPVRIGDRDCVLWFGWTGIAALQTEIGEDFDTKIGQALAGLDLDLIGRVLAIGLRESWPGVTAQEIAALSPPLATMTSAIALALKRAFYGLEEVPAQPGENPPLGRLKKALARMWFWRR